MRVNPFFARAETERISGSLWNERKEMTVAISASVRKGNFANCGILALNACAGLTKH
jgi:hypothetical protein